jgi:hypothetical protein
MTTLPEKEHNASHQNLLIEMVMRQTSYTYEDAELHLKNNNNDYMKVIKEALGIIQKNNTSTGSVNQQIYKEIRGLMDDGSKNYRISQENEMKKQQIIEAIRKKQMAEQDKLREQKSDLTKIEE